MQILKLLLVMVAIGFTPFSASADEFGERFSNKAPSGLGDYTAEETEFPDIAMDEMAAELQNIMPAAGEAVEEEAVSEEEAAQDSE